MTRSARSVVLAVLCLIALAPPTAWPAGLRVTWEPARPRAGDVVMMRVRGAPPGALIEAMVDGQPLGTFAVIDGHAGILGVDMDAPPGARAWRVVTTMAGAVREAVEGRLVVVSRAYHVQHLTVAPGMVDLDPETERRAVAEGERLRVTYRTISGERLWQGTFERPVAGDQPGTGFGARRVINGRPRAPHSGIDFTAPVGTPVLAANRGRVALVAEFFFPGRLVILDHGLGLHTAYFHLDTVAVSEGQLVARAQTLGNVGMTGRVTGPHLHFGAQVGAARIDPAALLGLVVRDDARTD